MSRFPSGNSPADIVLTPSLLAQHPQPGQQAKLIVQRVGLWVLCAYVVSGFLNELTLRLVGTQAYLLDVTLVLLPFLWLASGDTFRGLRHPIGKWWVAFLPLLLIATAFSIWRSGSLALLMNYIPRSYLLFFYVTALAATFSKCRQLMYVNIVASFMMLGICIFYGADGKDGRYYLPGGSGFFGNGNDLAFQLLIGITRFMYLFSRKSLLAKVLALSGIAASVPYLLWTGSRACVIGAIAYGILLLYLTRRRIRVLVIITVVAAIGLAFAPARVLNRLRLWTGDATHATSSDDMSAIESGLTRMELLKRSISETIAHPLLGVGPGQFPVAVSEEAKARDEWSQWLVTHNSYTEVSSECGIPAFICYMAIIVACFRMNFRLRKVSTNRPEWAEIANLNVALLSYILVYAVCSFFFSVAYTGTLPYCAGQTLALYLAAKQKLDPISG